MAYEKELEALQRWVKSVAGLNSVRLSDAQPKVARPVILWETPSRSKDRNLSRYQYVNKVTQYGRLYVNSLDQLLVFQENLLGDLEERVGVLPIYADGTVIANLKAVELVFTDNQGQSISSLDVPFGIKYEVTYGRTRPIVPPPATTVTTRVDTNYTPIVKEYDDSLSMAAAETENDKLYNFTGTVKASQSTTL